jgi:hypothetical protein
LLGTAWIVLLIVGFSVFGPAFIDLFKDFVKSLLGVG